MIQKNVADQWVGFYAYDKTTGDPALGLTIASFLSQYFKDGSATLGGAISGVGNFIEQSGSPTVDGGFYAVKLTADATNADHVTVDIKYAGDSNVVCTGLIINPTATPMAANITQVDGQAVTASSDPVPSNITQINGNAVAEGGSIDANITAVAGNTTAATVMAALHGTVVFSGTVEATSTDTLIESSDIASFTTSALVDAILVIGGTNAGAREPKVIASTDGLNTITLASPLSAAPTVGDTYVILGKGA